MIDYSKYNEITALACGVETTINEEFFDDVNIYYIDEFGCSAVWSIEDPRCREVIREHYKIDTCISIEDGLVDCYGVSDKCESVYSEGKTIAEAEIACIIKICDELDKG